MSIGRSKSLHFSMITFEAMRIGWHLIGNTHFQKCQESFMQNFKSVMGNFVNTNLLIAQQACMLLLNTCCKLCFLSLLYTMLFSFCSLPYLKSKRHGYAVVFMQLILSVDKLYLFSL